VASEHGERKLVAIPAADIAGYSRLASAEEERNLARLRTLLGDLIDPAIAIHRGRIVKRTGDGILIELRSVVDAARCAIEVQNSMIERNAGLPPDRRIEFRLGIHLGDVVEEADGDLMGDGVTSRRDSRGSPNRAVSRMAKILIQDVPARMVIRYRINEIRSLFHYHQALSPSGS